MSETNRREFIKRSVAALVAAGFGPSVMAQQEEGPAGIPTRPLGKTGVRLPIVGLGGYHVGVPEEKESIAIMHEAIDLGMTFFDNAWDYHNGGSEEKMGKALATGGRRQKVFLMTKCCGRDYKTANEHLEDSLRRLKTDVIDLWQFHEINWAIDSEWIYERGALRAAQEAQKAGKVRFIGFTGHRKPEYHLKMLATPYEWASVQMPINLLDAHYDSFQKQVVPECNRRKIGVIGMKALAGGTLPDKVGIAAEACRRFSLSLPISTLVCGIRSREELRQDVAMARSFKPMTAEELEKYLAEAKLPGSDGKLELWKTTKYGSAYHRKQHES